MEWGAKALCRSLEHDWLEDGIELCSMPNNVERLELCLPTALHPAVCFGWCEQELTAYTAYWTKWFPGTTIVWMLTAGYVGAPLVPTTHQNTP